MQSIGNIDSKYRFVILASKRAKQLLKGAKPKIKPKTKNLIRIAQMEISSGLVEYEILPTSKDDFLDKDESVFVGDKIAEDLPDSEDLADTAIDSEEPEEEDEDEESSEDESDEGESSEDVDEDLKE